jgi:hypothetical protein
MMDLHDHMADLRAETEPSPAVVQRLRQGHRPSRRRAPVVVPVLALAAGLLAAVWTGWPSAPDPAAPEPAAPEAPPPLAAAPALEPVTATWSGEASAGALGPHVQAQASGRGAVTGTAQDLAVDWLSGELRLEVDPAAGVALTVATEEAQVTVTGTVFAVRRDALGTHTSVERGRVEVVCGDAAPVSLAAGSTRTCLPRTATGWLRRAAALDRTAQPHAVLAAAEAGLASAPPPELALELGLHQAAALASLDRTDEARAVLARLTDDHPAAAGRIAQAASLLPLTPALEAP